MHVGSQVMLPWRWRPETLRACLEWMKIGEDEMKIGVKTFSIVWMPNKNTNRMESGLKIHVRLTKKFSLQSWDENGLKTG